MLNSLTCQVTKESFIDGGFFKTGDAVKVDEDGYYVILGRKIHILTNYYSYYFKY